MRETTPVATPVEQRTTSFSGLSILWDERVLEPRGWTAAQSHWVADLAAEAPPGPILELCCGAGHLGLLAARATGRLLVQVDSDPVAVAYARLNAERARVRSDVQCVDIRRPSVGEATYPLVLADPPWVPTADITRFPDDPPLAIDGGAAGSDLATACMEHAAQRLHPAGHLVLQIGSLTQLEELTRHPLLTQSGLALREVREYADGVLVHLAAPLARP